QVRRFRPFFPRRLSITPISYHATEPTHSHTLSLHDALPILGPLALRRVLAQLADQAARLGRLPAHQPAGRGGQVQGLPAGDRMRSEEHTSELQSRENLVCRLLLAKKNGAGRKYPQVIRRAAE